MCFRGVMRDSVMRDKQSIMKIFKKVSLRGAERRSNLKSGRLLRSSRNDEKEYFE